MKFVLPLSVATSALLVACALSVPPPVAVPTAPEHHNNKWCDRPVLVLVSDRFSDAQLENVRLALETWRAVGVDYLTVSLADDTYFGQPLDGVIQMSPAKDLGPDILGLTRIARDEGGCIAAAGIELVGTTIPTIAHEIGHALGLRHVDDPTNLLYPEATGAMGLEGWQREAVR